MQTRATDGKFFLPGGIGVMGWGFCVSPKNSIFKIVSPGNAKPRPAFAPQPCPVADSRQMPLHNVRYLIQALLVLEQ